MSRITDFLLNKEKTTEYQAGVGEILRTCDLMKNEIVRLFNTGQISENVREDLCARVGHIIRDVRSLQ